jgi:protein-disulfide isomerase-like protein with CxxC motif
VKISPEQLVAWQARGLIRETVGVRMPDAEPAPPQSERQFQAEVVKHAKRQGFKVYHTFDSRRSAAGFPDLVLIRNGKLIVAELKTDTGRVSAEQATWLELFAECGIPAMTWRPADWPEIVEKLK